MGGVRFRSGGKNIHAGMCVLWTSWKLHFILHFASPWVIRAYIYIYKNRRRFLNTWSRERALSIKYALRTFVKFLAVFFSRLRYEKMGTCSMILCNATLRTHQTKRKKKKTKNLRRKVTMYSAWKNISFVRILSKANEKGQEQRVLLSAWYRFSFPSCPLLYTLSEPINCNIPLSFAMFYQ